MSDTQNIRNELQGLRPSQVIIDELTNAANAEPTGGRFLSLPSIERVMPLLGKPIEVVCRLTLNEFTSLWLDNGLIGAQVEFEGMIADVVRFYRGAGYSLVSRRIMDHLTRDFTIQQVEYYERDLKDNGNIDNALAYAKSLKMVVPKEYPDDILPSDSRYDSLVSALILTYRESYRGNPNDVAMKVFEHKRNGFSVRQAERYECYYRQIGSGGEARDFATSSDEIPPHWKLPEWKAPEPKKVTWKETFLRSTFPDGVPILLAKKVAKLEDKKEILKTVFMHQNPKTPRKKKALKANPAMLVRLREHNLADHATAYLTRLERFYFGSDARRENREDLRSFVTRFGKVAKPVTADEGILTHPAFKVEKCGNDTTLAHGDRGFRIVVTTRNDVWFTHLGQSMNFGKLSFAISLRDQTIEYVKRPDNFSGNPNPYIGTSGKVCMGSNQASIMTSFKAGKLSDALSELFHTMTHFNPDSTPYEGLDHFFNKAQVGSLVRNNGEMPEIEVIA
jgi:hypothetical protein